MKTAEQWWQVMPIRASHSRIPSVDWIEQIQADALEFATQMMTANAADPEKAFNEIHRKRVSLLKK